jgi:hypothetical protein
MELRLYSLPVGAVHVSGFVGDGARPLKYDEMAYRYAVFRHC